MQKQCIVFLALALLLFYSSSRAAEPVEEEWPLHISILTSPVGGQWHTLGDQFAQSLSVIRPSYSRVGFGVRNISAVNSKAGDLGFTLTCFLKAALSGDARHRPSGGTNNVSVLAKLYPQVLYIAVRKDFAEKHNIKLVADLLKQEAPVRFATLKPGSASEFIVSLLLQYGYDTDFEALRAKGWWIQFYNIADMADKLSINELDCFAYMAGINTPLIQTLTEHTPVVFLPIQQPVLDTLQQQLNTGSYAIKAGSYKNVDHDITTLSDYACIIVRKDFPTDLVQIIVEMLWNNREQIGRGVGDFQYLNPETAIPRFLPTHPGAVKAWEAIKNRSVRL